MQLKQHVNPYAAELFVSILIHLKLELLTQFSASNDWKPILLEKINISQIKLFD